jgi:hypothetical protein
MWMPGPTSTGELTDQSIALTWGGSTESPNGIIRLRRSAGFQEPVEAIGGIKSMCVDELTLSEHHNNKGNYARETFGNAIAKIYSVGLRPDAVTDGTAYEQTVVDTTKLLAALTTRHGGPVPCRPAPPGAPRPRRGYHYRAASGDSRRLRLERDQHIGLRRR